MALNIRHSVQSAPVVVPPVTTWPKGSTAGVPTGTVLTNYTGPMDINVDGTLIENKIIRGTISVYGSNVTLRNCRILDLAWFGIIQYVDESTNLRVEYCDIDGENNTYHATGIAMGGGNSALIGCDIQGMVIAIKVWGPVQISGNYIHDLYESDPNPDARHFDGISFLGGGEVGASLIENNAIVMPDPAGGTSCVFMATQQGDITNVTVQDNLLMGQSAYTVYAADESSTATMSGIVIQNNYLEKGIYGYINASGSTPTISGNTEWDSAVDPTPAAVVVWQNST